MLSSFLGQTTGKPQRLPNMIQRNCTHKKNFAEKEGLFQLIVFKAGISFAQEFEKYACLGGSALP